MPSYETREPKPCPDGECEHSYDERPVGSVTQRERDTDQCPNCGWTETERTELTNTWLPKALEKLTTLGHEMTRIRPSETVLASVRDALSFLYTVGVKPSRIVAIASGGISLWFLEPPLRRQLEFSNDSPYLATLFEKLDDEVTITEVPLPLSVLPFTSRKP